MCVGRVVCFDAGIVYIGRVYVSYVGRSGVLFSVFGCGRRFIVGGVRGEGLGSGV